MGTNFAAEIYFLGPTRWAVSNNRNFVLGRGKRISQTRSPTYTHCSALGKLAAMKYPITLVHHRRNAEVLREKGNEDETEVWLTIANSFHALFIEA